MHDTRESVASRLAPILILFLAVFALSYRTLGTRTIEGLDAAHTIMDGIYFRDLFVDRPLNPISYTVNYYRQYPALGFLFWAPLFPFILGIAFLIGGLDVRIAHWCLLGCSFVLVLMAYLVARRKLPRALSVLAALLVIATPMVGNQSIMLMREVPALALAFAAFYAYLRFVESPGWKGALVLAAAGAAALYTKQTVVFIYPVLLLDVLLNHGELLRNRRAWLAAILLVVLLAPLAAFTIGVSKVNVQQSLGSDRSYILGAASLDRWSAAAWTFYPRALFRILNPIVLVLCLAAILYAVRRREFFRANVLWLGWIAAWLMVFSWLLAKETRHAILWIPAWCMLAVAFVAQLQARTPRLKHLHWVLAIPVLMGGVQIMRYRPPAYEGVEAVVKGILETSPVGNLMYFGRNRQVFIPYIRMRDPQRRVFTLQGDDILKSSSVGEGCRDFQVRYVMAEREDTDFEELLRQVSASGQFSDLGWVRIRPTWRAPVELRIFRYDGQVAAQMKRIPLNSRLVTAEVNERLKK